METTRRNTMTQGRIFSLLALGSLFVGSAAGCGAEEAPNTDPSPCAGTQIKCGGTCVEPATNPNNCGSCGNACGLGQSCTAGTCKCPTGALLCGGTCADTLRNPAHCGGCDQACSVGSSCQNGACVCEGGR